MGFLEVACRQSVSISKCRSMGKLPGEILLLGGWDEFLSLLYFSLPVYPGFARLKSAKIVLFKEPGQEPRFDWQWSACRGAGRHHYILSPLLEHFSIHSGLFHVPRADSSQRVEFCDDANLCYTEIDITKIAVKWLDNTLENKGLILTGRGNSRLICYASENSCIPGMRPVLRLAYKERAHCPGLSSVSCTVEVK